MKPSEVVSRRGAWDHQAALDGVAHTKGQMGLPSADLWPLNAPQSVQPGFEDFDVVVGGHRVAVPSR